MALIWERYAWHISKKPARVPSLSANGAPCMASLQIMDQPFAVAIAEGTLTSPGAEGFLTSPEVSDNI